MCSFNVGINNGSVAQIKTTFQATHCCQTLNLTANKYAKSIAQNFTITHTEKLKIIQKISN